MSDGITEKARLIQTRVNEIESLLPAGFQIPLINGRINIKAAPTAAASFL
jgi:hypothetical protein